MWLPRPQEVPVDPALTLVSEQHGSRLRPPAAEAEADLVAAAPHHKAPHQDAFVRQHAAVAVVTVVAVVAAARLFEGHLVSVQQVHVHHLEGKHQR